MAIDKRLFSVTKKGTAYRGKRKKGNNYNEKRGAVGFRGNSQLGANCQENDFVAIDWWDQSRNEKADVFS